MTFSREDLAIFSKQKLDFIIFPLFLWSIFYLPGYTIQNYILHIYPENFFLRQTTYVLSSLPVTILLGFGASMVDKIYTTCDKIKKNKKIL